MLKQNLRRLNIITGHYGAGKTNFAVNLALRLAAAGRRVCIVDLDIVNPYFRTNDCRRLLEGRGVQVMAPIYAGSNLDIPALPPEINAAFDDRRRTVLLDVGGDDAGAAALGRFASVILKENDYAHLHVVNFRRPLTETPELAAGVLRDVEKAGRVRATALVNNTNLSTETTADIVRASVPQARELARATGLPIACTCVGEQLAAPLGRTVPDLFPVKIYIHTPWTPAKHAEN